MKKVFPLHAPGRDDARVRDKIRQELNKYVRRERRKDLPEGFDAWEFACRVGPSEPAAEIRVLKEVGGVIDAVAASGAKEIYLEIVAVPAKRKFQH